MDKCADCIGTSADPCHTVHRGAVNIRVGCKREGYHSHYYTQSQPEYCVDGRPLMRQTANGPEMTEHQNYDEGNK